MKELERSLKALANRRRLAVLQHLKKNRRASVGDISRAIKLSFKSTSRHLAVLSAANIIEREQENLYMFYRLAEHHEPTVRQVISLL